MQISSLCLNHKVLKMRGKPSIVPYQEHIACSFAYKIVSSVVPDFDKPIVWYRGEMQRMNLSVCFSLKQKNCVPQEMQVSEDDEVHFECAQVCHICQQIIVYVYVIIVILLVFNRGVAHNACNLNYCISPKSWELPVVIHNLKGYDGHLIVTSLKSEFGKVRVISQNMEKYLSISVGETQVSGLFPIYTPEFRRPVKNIRG